MIVALYARVSTQGQDPDNQLIRLRELAARCGLQVVGEFVDVASGADARRPQLDAMMELARTRKIDKIMATKLDRLARSTINLANLIEDLDRWGVALELIDQPIDTSGPAGRMVLTVLGAMAQFERELISDRTKDGLERARRSGRRPGRPAASLSPYQVAKIRALQEEHPGISVHQIARQMEGISETTLRRLMKESNLI